MARKGSRLSCWAMTVLHMGTCMGISGNQDAVLENLQISGGHWTRYAVSVLEARPDIRRI